jgi:predicted RNA-binding protein (virulence factor B family)
MIEVGKFNNLRMLRETTVGIYLGDVTGEDILLPNKYCPENFVQDEEIEVFVYRDYADRKIATNLIPKIFLHEFALLQVNSIEQVGTFMDWGLEKDLMVPFSEQKQRMEEGRWYIVFLDLDTETDRLFASNKLEKYLQNKQLTISEGDEVELLIMQKTDLGYSAIINNRHKGLLYDSEVFTKLNIGEKKTGYIKKIREDNKIDLTLQAPGYEKSNDANAEKIFEVLKDHQGFIAANDKSTPEEISALFGMSKKSFKKAIGALYKEKKITIEERGISIQPQQ